MWFCLQALEVLIADGDTETQLFELNRTWVFIDVSDLKDCNAHNLSDG